MRNNWMIAPLLSEVSNDQNLDQPCDSTVCAY